MASILVVEDEKDLLSTLEYNLKREGHLTHAFSTGEDGLDWAVQHGPPDLALLDVMLPGISGIEVCYRLRAHERTRVTPVVFLTAKGEDIDRVIGFELGADDYIVKPFNIRELLLRVRAILRRSGQESTAMCAVDRVVGNLKLDNKRHQLWVDDQEVILTPLEFRLLAILLTRKGCVQSRETLLSEVWETDAPAHTRTVDVHINRLRDKLGSAGEMLETIRGVGYRIQGHH
ncbi:MAG: response regulator transcription factor [Magnetococcales bacterium]|nr:response regulator transcription factor [Magnetococcales bacterium]